MPIFSLYIKGNMWYMLHERFNVMHVLYISVIVLVTCGDWSEAKESFDRHLIFKVLFITHMVIFMGTIALFIVNILMLEFIQLYCIPFYVYLFSFAVLLLRYFLIFCFPWYVKWPLRGINGSGDLFL